MDYKILNTADGSKTIYLPDMDEQYHSLNGALAESNYVYIEKGYLCKNAKKLVIFEVGFGTGLNAGLTAIKAEKNNQNTLYYSIENFPLSKSVLDQLEHDSLFSGDEKSKFKKIHSAEWNKTEQISDVFSLHKIHSNIIGFDFSGLKKFDVVYFDAFGPDKQPEMWSQEIFNAIYKHCNPDAVFVTYSAKGEIRRQLSMVGFTVERLPGPPGKKQMLRGIKKV